MRNSSFPRVLAAFLSRKTEVTGAENPKTYQQFKQYFIQTYGPAKRAALPFFEAIKKSRSKGKSTVTLRYNRNDNKAFAIVIGETEFPLDTYEPILRKCLEEEEYVWVEQSLEREKFIAGLSGAVLLGNGHYEHLRHSMPNNNRSLCYICPKGVPKPVAYNGNFGEINNLRSALHLIEQNRFAKE